MRTWHYFSLLKFILQSYTIAETLTFMSCNVLKLLLILYFLKWMKFVYYCIELHHDFLRNEVCSLYGCFTKPYKICEFSDSYCLGNLLKYCYFSLFLENTEDFCWSLTKCDPALWNFSREKSELTLKIAKCSL